MPLSDVTYKSNDNNKKNRFTLKKLFQEEKWWNDLSLGHIHCQSTYLSPEFYYQRK